MKRFYVVMSLILAVGFSGCVGSGPKVVIDKDRIPLSVNQVASLHISGGTRDYVQKLVGNPIDAHQEGNDHYWTYPVKDELLKEETTIIVKIGYSSGISVNKSMSELPFKKVDLDRDKYYYLKSNLDKSNSSVRYLSTNASYEEKTRNENEKMHAKESKQKYRDELFNLKQKLIKERGQLPKWFTVKL